MGWGGEVWGGVGGMGWQMKCMPFTCSELAWVPCHGDVLSPPGGESPAVGRHSQAHHGQAKQ